MYRKLCGKYNQKRDGEWYAHIPESVTENEEMRILLDVIIKYDREIEVRKPGIFLSEEERQKLHNNLCFCPCGHKN